MTEIGWRFERRNPAGLTVPVGFTATGSFSFDSTRDTPKTITGFTLIPEEAMKVDTESDQVLAYLVIDGVEYSMGVYNFNNRVAQKDAVKGPNGLPADLLSVSLADECLRLQRNDGRAQSLWVGFDPSSEMRALLDTTGIPYQVAGSPNLAGSPITWDGSTKMIDKVRQLGELAGHLPLWMDRFGVIRSTTPQSMLLEPIPLEELRPEAGSIAVTDSYLSAPNRVIVADNSGGQYPIIGQWDAPGNAPHSAIKRGYVTTEMVDIQGLESSDHANRVASVLGLKYSARRLSATVMPTYRLDGPVTVSYDDALWTVSSWTVGTDPGSTMNVDLEEYVGGE